MDGSIDRFDWWDEGNSKWGWWTNSSQPGASITLRIPSAPAHGSTPAGAQVMLALGCTKSGTKLMGDAHVSCVSGCACEATTLGGTWDWKNSQTAMFGVRASQHPDCHLKFKVGRPLLHLPCFRAEFGGSSGILQL